MIKAEQIPDEVINAYMHMIVYGGVDGAEAIAAALTAWPGTTTTRWFQDTAWQSVVNLPIKEPTDDR